MAQQLGCDICQDEIAVQMLTNMESGETMTLGRACLLTFYERSVLVLLEAGQHKGPAGKCQACRRVHEKVTTPVAPLGAEPETPAEPDVSRETPEPEAETG